VIHVANPFQENTLSEQEFIATSIDATKNIMNAAVKAKVTKVVITESMATVCGSQRSRNPNHLWNEDDFNDEPSSTYSKAKTFAERSAWEIAKEKQLLLSTVHPSAIFGPLLPRQTPTSTNDWILKFANGSYLEKGVPPSTFGVCDARDVAAVHLAAMKSPTSARHMVTSAGSYTSLDVCELISTAFPQLAVPKKFNVPNVQMKFRELSSDQSRTAAFLGRQLFTPLQTIKDTVESFVAAGQLSV